MPYLKLSQFNDDSYRISIEDPPTCQSSNRGNQARQSSDGTSKPSTPSNQATADNSFPQSGPKAPTCSITPTFNGDVLDVLDIYSSKESAAKKLVQVPVKARFDSDGYTVAKDPASVALIARIKPRWAASYELPVEVRFCTREADPRDNVEVEVRTASRNKNGAAPPIKEGAACPDSHVQVILFGPSTSARARISAQFIPSSADGAETSKGASPIVISRPGQNFACVDVDALTVQGTIAGRLDITLGGGKAKAQVPFSMSRQRITEARNDLTSKTQATLRGSFTEYTIDLTQASDFDTWIGKLDRTQKRDLNAELWGISLEVRDGKVTLPAWLIPFAINSSEAPRVLLVDGEDQRKIHFQVTVSNLAASIDDPQRRPTLQALAPPGASGHRGTARAQVRPPSLRLIDQEERPVPGARVSYLPQSSTQPCSEKERLKMSYLGSSDRDGFVPISSLDGINEACLCVERQQVQLSCRWWSRSSSLTLPLIRTSRQELAFTLSTSIAPASGTAWTKSSTQDEPSRVRACLSTQSPISEGDGRIGIGAFEDDVAPRSLLIWQPGSIPRLIQYDAADLFMNDMKLETPLDLDLQSLVGLWMQASMPHEIAIHLHSSCSNEAHLYGNLLTQSFDGRADFKESGGQRCEWATRPGHTPEKMTSSLDLHLEDVSGRSVLCAEFTSHHDRKFSECIRTSLKVTTTTPLAVSADAAHSTDLMEDFSRWLHAVDAYNRLTRAQNDSVEEVGSVMAYAQRASAGLMKPGPVSNALREELGIALLAADSLLAAHMIAQVMQDPTLTGPKCLSLSLEAYRSPLARGDVQWVNLLSQTLLPSADPWIAFQARMVAVTLLARDLGKLTDAELLARGSWRRQVADACVHGAPGTSTSPRSLLGAVRACRQRVRQDLFWPMTSDEPQLVMSYVDQYIAARREPRPPSPPSESAVAPPSTGAPAPATRTTQATRTTPPAHQPAPANDRLAPAREYNLNEILHRLPGYVMPKGLSVQMAPPVARWPTDPAWTPRALSALMLGNVVPVQGTSSAPRPYQADLPSAE